MYMYTCYLKVICVKGRANFSLTMSTFMFLYE